MTFTRLQSKRMLVPVLSFCVLLSKMAMMDLCLPTQAMAISQVSRSDSQQEPFENTTPAPASNQSTTDSASAAKASPKATAKGIVFFDLNNDRKWNDGDKPAVNVKVSNGFDIVTTNEQGQYEITLAEGEVLFVVKPKGFRTHLNSENLPQFFYIHKPNGSPKLMFSGSKPTGTLPQSIDFPLYPQNEPEKFNLILFGDPQPRNMAEVDYIGRDVISELVGNPNRSAFGVSLGDLAFDNLDTLEPLNQVVGLVGIPWYNVIGNHDINTDASRREDINETFERIYGPSWYSFDYGNVHFVVMDNIDWNSPTEKVNRFHFAPRFGERQMEFLKRDLSLIPESQMVVLMMHVPIVGVEDREEVYRLIEQRPLCISISGHTHDHQHRFLGEKDGFKGSQSHHHIINVTVSGGWWGGRKDERGVPHAMMGDGAPNGYSFLTFDGNEYRLDYKAAGKPASEQMKIHFPKSMTPSNPTKGEFSVNVFNGSERSIVEMAIDGSDEWVQLERRVADDPNFVELAASELKQDPDMKPAMPKPVDCQHLWFGKLPEGMAAGTHLLRIRTTDMHARVYEGHRTFRVAR